MGTPWEDPQFHGGRTLRGQGLQSLDLLHPDSSSLVHDDSVFLWKVFTLSAWWLSPTPLKNDGVKVSWDDDIPNIWKVIKAMFQTTNQLMALHMARNSRLSMGEYEVK